jgi:Flp pilus assembly protein TadD
MMRDIHLKQKQVPAWLALLLLALVAGAVYGNIYDAPFVFDDKPNIIETDKTRDLGAYLSLDRLATPRSLVDLTLALNYRFGELEVFGYHLVNVLIHILNGLVVYFFARAVFRRIAEFPDSSGRRFPVSAIPWMALFASLIFVAHPIQTQAVTYTIQRSASMAALFYMTSVLLYIRARMSAISDQRSGKTRHYFWFYGLSGLCGAAAFLCKKNAASLPGAILLVEYVLVDRSWAGWKQKMPWSMLCFGLWVAFVFYVMGFFSDASGGALENVSDLMRQTETVGHWPYLCTQFSVLVIYVRLLFIPVGQRLDWLYGFKAGFFEGATPLAMLFLLGLLALGVWQVKRRPWVTLGILWFFITLSVESSIFPISDALFEHRLYLPMFGFGLCVSGLVYEWLWGRGVSALVVSAMVVVALGTAAHMRNRVWGDEIRLWREVIAKSAENPRAHNNLGLALIANGRVEEAGTHFREALGLMPDYADAHINLGAVLKRQGDLTGAVRHYLKALHLRPDHAVVHNNLGNLLTRMGQYHRAVRHLKAAAQLRPDYADAHNNLGNALAALGRLQAAVSHYETALRLEPGHGNAHYNLGNALFQQGDVEGAVRHYLKALHLKPGYPAVHNNLGMTLMEQGRLKQAQVHFIKALELRPGHHQAADNLEKVRRLMAENAGRAGTAEERKR